MDTLELDTKLVEGYLSLLKNMNPRNRQQLITKLSKFSDEELSKKESNFYTSFGAWEGKETGEELIKQVKEARTFKRPSVQF